MRMAQKSGRNKSSQLAVERFRRMIIE